MPRTRDALVAATQEAIRDVGLQRATAREIAGRAGANLASIPYHFETKDALVAEALVTEARQLVAPVLDLLATDLPADERAARAAALLVGVFDEHRSQVPGYLSAVAAVPHMPEVRRGLAALWADLRGRLADDIGVQVAAGSLPGWVDPGAMAAAVLALVNGVVVAAAVDPDGPDHRAIAAQFLALLVAARTTP